MGGNRWRYQPRQSNAARGLGGDGEELAASKGLSQNWSLTFRKIYPRGNGRKAWEDVHPDSLGVSETTSPDTLSI